MTSKDDAQPDDVPQMIATRDLRRYMLESELRRRRASLIDGLAAFTAAGLTLWVVAPARPVVATIMRRLAIAAWLYVARLAAAMVWTYTHPDLTRREISARIAEDLRGGDATHS